jgi:hypothetical protein
MHLWFVLLLGAGGMLHPVMGPGDTPLVAATAPACLQLVDEIMHAEPGVRVVCLPGGSMVDHPDDGDPA